MKLYEVEITATFEVYANDPYEAEKKAELMTFKDSDSIYFETIVIDDDHLKMQAAESQYDAGKGN